MKVYSKEEFNRIGKDYRGQWRDTPWVMDRVAAGEVPAAYIGRRTVMEAGEYGCELLTEGVHFLVEDDYEKLPILQKANAMAGCCYRFVGGYIEVTRVYRVTEEFAQEYDLYHLDRVEYIQHAKWGQTQGGCALPGSDIREG